MGGTLATIVDEDCEGIDGMQTFSGARTRVSG